MNPWINIILLIPAFLIAGIIVLIRIKGKLENNIYRYRHEGIVLHTSLTLFRLRNEGERRIVTLGLVMLTGERLIVFNWKQRIVYECEFRSSGNRACNLRISANKKNVIVRCECSERPRELAVTVRNPDAWELEFSRLRSYSSSV